MRDPELRAQLASADRIGLAVNLIGTGILAIVALAIAHSALAALAVLGAGLIWTLLTHGFAALMGRNLD